MVDTHTETHTREERVVTQPNRQNRLMVVGLGILGALCLLLFSALIFDWCGDDHMVQADIATQVGEQQPYRMTTTADDQLTVSIEQKGDPQVITLPNRAYSPGCVLVQTSSGVWDCVPTRALVPPCEEGEVMVTRGGEMRCEKIVSVEMLKETTDEMITEDEFERILDTHLPIAVKTAIVEYLEEYTDEVLVPKLQSLESRLRKLIRNNARPAHVVPVPTAPCGYPPTQPRTIDPSVPMGIPTLPSGCL